MNQTTEIFYWKFLTISTFDDYFAEGDGNPAFRDSPERVADLFLEAHKESPISKEQIVEMILQHRNTLIKCYGAGP